MWGHSSRFDGPALRARPEEMGVAVAVMALFGLVAMFLYPALYPLIEPFTRRRSGADL